MKFVTSKVKAHEILPDDRIKVGGRMYRVSENDRQSGCNSRRHILAYPLDSSELDERISVFLPSLQKFKIYNQKVRN